MKNSTLLLFVFILTATCMIACSTDNNKSKTEEASTHNMEQTTGQLIYTPAEGWIEEKPGSSMRKTQFRLPGQNGSGDAELAVFVFPGSGGGVEANIDRWIGQFIQPDGNSSAEKANISKTQNNGLSITNIYLTGTYLKGTMGGPVSELPDYAMLAAIIETDRDPWFFKAVGPQKTIDYWRSSFESFITTIKESQ